MLKIGGVPEHFNYPIKQALKKFQGEISWKDIPEGTGAMCQKLRTGELDVAIILTEGIVKDINQGSSARILMPYVTSPLNWGVFTGANSSIKSADEINNFPIAISRFGSGSHLMSYVLAKKENITLKQEQFKIVNTLQQATQELQQNPNTFFLWEHFTTQPLVENGNFKQVGIIPTPWPCFVIAVANTVSKAQLALLENEFLPLVEQKTKELKLENSSVKILAEEHNLKETAVSEWLNKTAWFEKINLKKIIDKVQEYLLDLKLIDRQIPVNDYLLKR
jgi:hypothetical protein